MLEQWLGCPDVSALPQRQQPPAPCSLAEVYADPGSKSWQHLRQALQQFLKLVSTQPAHTGPQEAHGQPCQQGASQEAGQDAAAVRVQPGCGRPAPAWHSEPFQPDSQPAPYWAGVGRPGGESITLCCHLRARCSGRGLTHNLMLCTCMLAVGCYLQPPCLLQEHSVRCWAPVRCAFWWTGPLLHCGCHCLCQPVLLDTLHCCQRVPLHGLG